MSDLPPNRPPCKSRTTFRYGGRALNGLPYFSFFTETNTIMTDKGMEQWDLTSSVSPYLDRHMMFPLLEYLDTCINKGLLDYSSKDVAAARLALLRPTHMVDYAIDIYKGLHDGDVPKEMEEQKAHVYQRLEELRAGCSALDKLCNNKEERVS